MKVIHWIIIGALIIGAALLIVRSEKKLAQQGATPTPKPPFSQSGEVTAVSESQVTIRYLTYIEVNGQQSSVYDSLSVPLDSTTPIFTLQKKTTGEGYTSTKATLEDIKVGMQVAVQLADKEGFALLPLKIDVFPQ